MVEKKSTKAKSTPKKRTAKKVEESTPESGTQQVEPVKPQINWDVIGFSSAAVTLFGTAIIFMIGWAYDANWYAYFGVGMEQVSISPQQILIDSLPALYYVLFILFSVLLRQLMAVANLSTLPKRLFTRNDVVNLLIGTDFMLFVISVLYTLVGFNNSKTSFADIPIPTLLFLSSVLMMFLLIFIPIPLEKAQTDNAIKSSNNLIKMKTKMEMIFSFFGDWKLSILLFLAFFFIISLSASIGILDAKKGVKGMSGYIQQVFLVSNQPLGFLRELEESCNESGKCIYGPFGFISENASSYYLVLWNKESADKFTENLLAKWIREGFYTAPKVFPRAPGLFIFPRNDPSGGYFIIPASLPELASDSETPFPIQLSTPTYIDTPQPTATTTPTKRPTITTTPIVTLTDTTSPNPITAQP